MISAMFYVPFIILILSGIALTALLFNFVARLKKYDIETFNALGRPNASYFLTARWVTSPSFLIFLLARRTMNAGSARLDEPPNFSLMRVLTFLHIGSWLIGFVSSVIAFWSH